MLTFDQIKELVELVRESGLQGIEIERSGFRLKIDGQRSVAELVTGRSPHVTSPEAPEEFSTAPVVENVPAASAGPKGRHEVEEDGGHQLTSPIVGTFYSAPSPEAAPYVTVGDVVKKGQVLCIIEAMKLMNEIEADETGEVVAIYPENAQPVEFGEPLFLIRTSG